MFHLVKVMGFPVVMGGCESWVIKKPEHWRIDAFELWCWRRLSRAPWTGRRSNQSIQGKSVLDIHWKDWCWSWSSNPLSTLSKELTLWKRPWYREGMKVRGEGDDRGWDGWAASPTQWPWVWESSRIDREAQDGQGSLACCCPWGLKESDVTERLNWTDF